MELRTRRDKKVRAHWPGRKMKARSAWQTFVSEKSKGRMTAFAQMAQEYRDLTASERDRLKKKGAEVAKPKVARRGKRLVKVAGSNACLAIR